MTALERCSTDSLYKDTMGSDEFKETELKYGITVNENCVLLEKDLNIGFASSLMYDWMHISLSGGILASEFGMCTFE